MTSRKTTSRPPRSDPESGVQGTEREGRVRKNRIQPLEIAAWRGDQQGVRRAVDDGESIESRGVFGMTPLEVAAESNNVELLKTILREGADPNANHGDVPYNYSTPLTAAAAAGALEAAEVLLEFGADVKKICLSSGRTPLHAVAESNSDKLTRLLLEHHPDLEVKDRNGHTPLVFAALQDARNVFEALIFAGAATKPLRKIHKKLKPDFKKSLKRRGLL